MDLRSQVGVKSSWHEDQASPEALKAFADAVGSRSGVPPTFLTVCRKGEFEMMQTLGVKLSSVLHGEQEYVYEGEIRPGDMLRYQTELTQAFEKRGASSMMKFLVFETRLQARAGSSGEPRPVGLSRTTIILRGGA